MPTPERSVPIALLSQTGEAGRHLREALESAGTPIVYEAHAAQLDVQALEQSGARVVVVNLDADVEAHLDDVYALLSDDRYNVIFNEAQVSAQLSGWEQARWARHLAAKILGTSDADPPRPKDAEAVPVRAQAITAAPVLMPIPDADPSLTQAYEPVARPDQPIGDGTVSADADGDAEFADIARLLAESDELPNTRLADEFLVDAADGTAAAADGNAIDLSGFEIDESAPPPFAGDVGTTPMQTPSEALPARPEATEIEDTLGFGDLDDFAGDPEFVSEFETDPPASKPATASEFDLEALLAEPPTGDPTEIEYVGPDAVTLDIAAELADSAEAIMAASDDNGLEDLELLDLDWADAPVIPVADADLDEIVVPPPPVAGSAFAWTLSDADEGAPAATESTTPAVSPSEFGIEKITAAEYLAPATPVDDAVELAVGGLAGLSLELVPLEEAVAPQSVQSNEVRESWLDTSTLTHGLAVRKVWVLGASIGGPEAVRDFLAHIPKDYPALFLLAQHMGAEFMDLMAQQLAKSSMLTVRTPTHGERVAHGDIVIVPTTHRLRVDAEGVIVLEPVGESIGSNVPSIDQVLHDVADRFGAKAGVIVFSGMAEDAADGSRYLAAKGGKVYVQDPRTCVISSMVDGVLETGVVSFTGSPRELAERLLGERPRPAA